MYETAQIKSRGFTFIELLVTIAVTTLVFGGIVTTIQLVSKIISTTKVATSAMALANQRMEYIRSLPYADVGTVAGIPNGLIPQNSTTTLNGFIFHERVVVQYVDSPDDGTGAFDVNGILADYKEVKVEYSWMSDSGTSTIFLLTNVVPPGIESTTGGGTLTVNVFDAGVLPVAGAEVHIYNNTGTTTVDTIRYANSSGVAMFAGAPAGANYEITVSSPGYSTDKTYSATTSNPNPTTPHVAVLESAVSTMNFQIDTVSDLLIRTVGPATTNSFTDSFMDTSALFSSVDTQVSGGSMILAGGSGTYSVSGSALSIPEIPASIDAWDTATWNGTTPPNTTLTVQVYRITGTSTYALVPDVDLPGNSVGFTIGTIDLSSLNSATYTGLALGANLGSSDAFVTPSLDDWNIGYVISEPIIGSVPFTLTGTKIIGMTAALVPIYKYTESHTTNGSGEIQLEDLEWDFYDIVLDTGAYNISQVCPSLPYTLDPGVSETLTMTLVSGSAYSLRVSVVDSSGNPVTGATVDISRSGFSDSGSTSTCGQVFFDTGISAQPDYQIDVEALGYVDQTITDINVDGNETLVVTLVSS